MILILVRSSLYIAIVVARYCVARYDIGNGWSVAQDNLLREFVFITMYPQIFAAIVFDVLEELFTGIADLMACPPNKLLLCCIVCE